MKKITSEKGLIKVQDVKHSTNDVFATVPTIIAGLNGKIYATEYKFPPDSGAIYTMETNSVIVGDISSFEKPFSFMLTHKDGHFVKILAEPEYNILTVPRILRQRFSRGDAIVYTYVSYRLTRFEEDFVLHAVDRIIKQEKKILITGLSPTSYCLAARALISPNFLYYAHFNATERSFVLVGVEEWKDSKEYAYHRLVIETRAGIDYIFENKCEALKRHLSQL